MRSACWLNISKKLPSRGNNLPNSMQAPGVRRKGNCGECNCRPRSAIAEYEIGRAHHAQRRPEVIELERLLQVVHGERQEHRQRDDLLHDLELADAVPGL